MKKHDGHET